MSKELTEQYFNATLKTGTYYVLDRDGNIDIDYYGGDNFQWSVVKEVLAPVPDYMDCKGLMYDSIALDKVRKRVDELVSKTKQLEDRLKEAESVIRLYLREEPPLNSPPWKKYSHAVAKQYLEKYGVEK